MNYRVDRPALVFKIWQFGIENFEEVFMKNLDCISGLILFLFGFGIFLKSQTYPIGSFKTPGAGLFPLLASIILMGLSAVMTIQAFFVKGEEPGTKFFLSSEAPRRIILGFVSLIGFRYLLPVIGFGFSTFIFVLIFAKFLGRYTWKVSVLFSVLTAVTSYYFFQVFLKMPMPRSLLGI
jgi:hypothetical protein